MSTRSKRRSKSKSGLADDTTVTVFTMAPEALKEVLRKALAMGADEAVLLCDEGLEGSDVWATAYAMSQALKKIGFDLLIVGGLTDDGSTGAVPGALAEHLACRASPTRAKPRSPTAS